MIFSAAVLNLGDILAVKEISWYQKEKEIFCAAALYFVQTVVCTAAAAPCLLWAGLLFVLIVFTHNFCSACATQFAYFTQPFSGLYFALTAGSFGKLLVVFEIVHVGLGQLIVCVVHKSF
jgi:hypothetical protein